MHDSRRADKEHEPDQFLTVASVPPRRGRAGASSRDGSASVRAAKLPGGGSETMMPV